MHKFVVLNSLRVYREIFNGFAYKWFLISEGLNYITSPVCHGGLYCKFLLKFSTSQIYYYALTSEALLAHKNVIVMVFGNLIIAETLRKM